ncbi:hypothetical protein GEV33_004959 [Tenebrio molitor]|uniref:Uncharacterized protein n=1 Tax=Tenebrio molitor TaxID=7067 RepID=A0A8J6HNR1_TENMO|nr:hypothetical protein GEV33_004959 [Tenebrio molitor]
MDEEGGDWFTDAGDDAPPSQPEAASAGPAATPKEGEAPADDAQAKDAPEQEKREIAEEEYLDPDKLLLFKHWISMVENSLDDDLRPGRPVDTITLDVIEKTKYLVLEDLRLKERQLAPLLGVSETTVFRILHEYLGMKKASARWVPRMLSQFQMRVRMEMCEHFLTLCGDEPDLIINRFVTGDEIWAHLFDPKSKQELMQWHIKGSSPPKKFKVTPPAEKIMATVFCNCQGILMIDSLNKGSTVTGE